MLKRLLTCVALIACLAVGSGCTPGLLYTDITRPLCENLRGRPLGTRSAEGISKRVEIPTTRVDITAEWDSRAMGDIAKAHGIKTIYACDSRRRSYVLGIWREDSVIIYGD